MKPNKTVEKHGAYRATIVDNEAWVRAVAREVDLKTEIHLAWDLCRIMIHFEKLHDFAGVSSNNIFWEATEVPIRMIRIPFQNDMITVINPRYERLAGRSINSTERCGSIPKLSFVVKRKTYVAISGYDMDGEQIELEYGSKRGSGEDCQSWVIQHEMDHLDGILIKDRAIYK